MIMKILSLDIVGNHSIAEVSTVGDLCSIRIELADDAVWHIQNGDKEKIDGCWAGDEVAALEATEGVSDGKAVTNVDDSHETIVSCEDNGQPMCLGCKAQGPSLTKPCSNVLVKNVTHPFDSPLAKIHKSHSIINERYHGVLRCINCDKLVMDDEMQEPCEPKRQIFPKPKPEGEM